MAETARITHDAALPHIAQPAVSRQLRLLKEDLGMALFEQGRHGIVTESCAAERDMCV